MSQQWAARHSLHCHSGWHFNNHKRGCLPLLKQLLTTGWNHKHSPGNFAKGGQSFWGSGSRWTELMLAHSMPKLSRTCPNVTSHEVKKVQFFGFGDSHPEPSVACRFRIWEAPQWCQKFAFYFLPLELWFRKLIVSSLPASLQSFLLFSFPLFLALLLPVLLGSPPSSPSGHPHTIALQAFLSQHLRKLKLLCQHVHGIAWSKGHDPTAAGNPEARFGKLAKLIFATNSQACLAWRRWRARGSWAGRATWIPIQSMDSNAIPATHVFPCLTCPSDAAFSWKFGETFCSGSLVWLGKLGAAVSRTFFSVLLRFPAAVSSFSSEFGDMLHWFACLIGQNSWVPGAHHLPLVCWFRWSHGSAGRRFVVIMLNPCVWPPTCQRVWRHSTKHHEPWSKTLRQVWTAKPWELKLQTTRVCPKVGHKTHYNSSFSTKTGPYLWFSPHYCVGFLFFAWIPPLSSAAVRRRAALTTHLSEWVSEGVREWVSEGVREEVSEWVSAHSLTHSRLPFAWQAQYTEPPRGAAASVAAAGPQLPFAWQAQYKDPPRGAAARVAAGGPRLPFAWQVQYTEPPGGAAARVAVGGPRLPFAWQAQYTGSCGARGRRWPAAAFCVAGAVYTEPPGRAAARVAAAGAAAAFRVAGAVHRASWTSCRACGRRWSRGCLSRGRRSTQMVLEARDCLLRGRCSTHSFLVELRRAWPLLARGCLLRGRRSTQSLLDELRRAWPPLGPRLPFAWQAQYTEPPGGAAARVAAAGAAAAFRVAGAVHRSSCSRLRRRRLIITTHHGPSYHITTSHHNSSQLITPYHIPSHHSSASHTSLITAPLLVTTNHSSTSNRSTSHHNSSQLITTQIMTVPLLTPHFSHHNFLSQLITTYHIPTHHSSTSHTPSHTSLNLSHPNSSQLHLSHLTSQVHFSHLTSHTSPKFTLTLDT